MSKEISKQDLLEALQRCKEAQKDRKKRQQEYCIKRYYKQKEEKEKEEKQ